MDEEERKKEVSEEGRNEKKACCVQVTRGSTEGAESQRWQSEGADELQEEDGMWREEKRTNREMEMKCTAVRSSV